MIYDTNNIFARILRGEIPAKTVYDDEFALAFHDIAPQAPIHILAIPKGNYISFQDFCAHASAAEITGFFRAVAKITVQLGLVEPGFRALTNHGTDGHQAVPHFHLHIFGGKRLGSMLIEEKL